MKTTFLVLLSFLPLFALVYGAPVVVERDINAFLAQIALLFPFSGLIQDISGLITAASVTLGAIFGIQETENNLAGPCAPLTVIFARGTSEPGNVGVIVGPSFFSALESLLGGGKVSMQGVAYPASVEGFLAGGDASGAQTMANLVTQAFSQCPSTKVVMGGYSQGGQVVHKAAQLLPAATMNAVSSVVIFGDPDNGQPIANAASGATMTVCHPFDDICDGGDLILIGHLTYAENANNAATFAAGRAGF